ncbi:hypothetical protein [Lactiplantibacillus carotarum]|uniref:hypothetical protein n=1 Tax=Lactiplantibacillus carotarum TaxID=2993456 RepID=UPI00298EE270|nr:hypothetical protein [Lactiplantibacillus carotarum]
MQRIWGLGVAIGLAGLLVGCQTANQQTYRSVQPNHTSVTTVRQVRASDFLGRWVSPTPATSLYLNSNHQAALFTRHQAPIRGQFTLQLTNDQALVTISDHHAIRLDLDDATSMTMRRNHANVKLTKDPNWQARHSEMPTQTSVALKPASLTPTFQPTY